MEMTQERTFQYLRSSEMLQIKRRMMKVPPKCMVPDDGRNHSMTSLNTMSRLSHA